MSANQRPSALHATAFVIEEYGILVRGASGTGKTRLALAATALAQRDGRFARLVADDRTLVTRHGDRLVARPHPATAGLAERRGLGIVRMPHEPACVLRLAVDLVCGWPPRLPGDEARRTMIGGVVLAHLSLAIKATTADSAALIIAVLEASTTAG